LIKCYENIKNGFLKRQEKNFKISQFDRRLPKLERRCFFFKKKQFLLAFLRERIKLTISSGGGVEQACTGAAGQG
jgi:hypothetical protein